MLPPVFRLLYGQRSYFGSHCVCSNSCISWRISFIFCMEVYLGKIYTPIVFGDAAPSVPSFIGSKVIFWWKCVRSAGHISLRISFKFCTDVHHSQIYTPSSLWWSCPQCSVFYRVKGHILVHILVCALTATFFDGFLSYLYGGVTPEVLRRRRVTFLCSL